MATDIGHVSPRPRRDDDTQWGAFTENLSPRICCDQNLESAFDRLRLSPFYRRTQQSGPVGVITCGSGGVENPVNSFTANQQYLLPFLFQTTQPTDVELPRLTGNGGGIPYGDHEGTWAYRTGTNNEEENGRSYQGLDVIERRLTPNSLWIDSRCWNGRGEHSGQVVRSAPYSNLNLSPFDVSGNSCLLMDDMRHNKQISTRFCMNDLGGRWFQKPLNHFCLDEYRGNIVSLAKDQQGCRLLQKKMDGLTEKKVDELFMELIKRVDELMIDPYGNYVIQKLVEVCSEEQRTRILLVVTMTEFQLVNICLDMHGTRAVQKLLDHLTTKEQISIVMAGVSPGAVALTKDMNGHHVIQHCLKHFSNEDNRYLLNEVANNCVGIATHKSGCCVLQQCVDYSHGELKKRLISEIISSSLLLSTDCYGNYVVQHLLGLKMPSVTASLLRRLQGNYMSLSYDKYGSNVVERCLIESGQDQSALIISELLRDQNVSMLLVDPFGNYVIQTALSVSKGGVNAGLQALVQMYSPKMRSSPYGRKILAGFQMKKSQRS